jgi:hypothetical protein
MLVGSLPNGSTKKAGMSFMKYVNDTIIVYILSAITDFAAARRANADFIGHRLFAVWTEFHECCSMLGMFPEIIFGRPARAGDEQNPLQDDAR